MAAGTLIYFDRGLLHPSLLHPRVGYIYMHKCISTYVHIYIYTYTSVHIYIYDKQIPKAVFRVKGFYGVGKGALPDLFWVSFAMGSQILPKCRPMNRKSIPNIPQGNMQGNINAASRPGGRYGRAGGPKP